MNILEFKQKGVVRPIDLQDGFSEMIADPDTKNVIVACEKKDGTVTYIRTDLSPGEMYVMAGCIQDLAMEAMKGR